MNETTGGKLASIDHHIGLIPTPKKTYFEAAKEDLPYFLEPNKGKLIGLQDRLEDVFSRGILLDPEEAKKFLNMVDKYVSESASNSKYNHVRRIDQNKRYDNATKLPESILTAASEERKTRPNKKVEFDAMRFRHATKLTPDNLVKIAIGRINYAIHLTSIHKRLADLEKQLRYPTHLLQYVHMMGNPSSFNMLYKYAKEKNQLPLLRRSMREIVHSNESKSILGSEALGGLIAQFNWNTRAEEMNRKYFQSKAG